MALVFNIPECLEDLDRPSESQDRLSCERFVAIETLRAVQVDELVKDVIHDLTQREVLSIEDQDLFDQVYSLIRGFSSLEVSNKTRLAESLCSNLSVVIASIGPLLASAGSSAVEEEFRMQSIRSTRNALKIYVYFLEQMISPKVGNRSSTKQRPAKGKGRKNRPGSVSRPWDPDMIQTRFARLVAAVVVSDLKQLFGSGAPEEAFIAQIAKFSFTMLESDATVKHKELKEALYVIISSCASQYGYREQSLACTLHLLHRFDHLHVHLAELVALSDERFGDSAFAVAVIHEIGRTSPKDYTRESSGADNVGLFLVELSNRLPKLVCTNLSTLMPHMDSENYKMRSALVQMMGVILAKAFGDPSGNGSVEPSPSRTRQALLERLLERTRDTNSFTRAKVLQTWAGLCEQGAISIGHWNLVADIAAGRLQDKSAHVRKSALQLLATLLKFNPFGPQLRSAAFEATLEKYKKQLEEMSSPAMSGSSDTDEGSTHEVEANGDPVSEAIMNLDGMSDSPDESTGDASEGSVDLNAPVEQSSPDQASKPLATPVQTQQSPLLGLGGLEQIRALVASLEVGLQFAKCMASTMPVLAQLLGSQFAWDVENSIQLLICCKQFLIDGSADNVRKILPLVFSREKGIQDAVEDAFITLYVKKSPVETASNLINLTLDANLGDLASIETLVSKFMSKGEISQSTVSHLWQIFRFNAAGVTAEQSRGALGILCMGAKTCPKILCSNVQIILDIGFGCRAKEDVLLARFACIALQRLPDEERAKLGYNHKAFSLLSTVICKGGLPEVVWYSVAEEAINTIYLLHPTPEKIVSDIVLRFSQSVFTGTKSRSEVHCNSEREDSAEAGVVKTSEFSDIPASAVSRFFFVVAHVALKHLVYVETCLRNLRRQIADKDQMQKGDTKQTDGSVSKKESITDELGLTASEDARLDDLLEKAEKEIVYGGVGRKTLISFAAPLVAKLCKKLVQSQQHSELWAASVLALCKLMAIDAEFCEQNLQLLFTIVHTSTEEALRSNCVIAWGDLCMRFPNLLEPWTDHIYSRLHDSSAVVRKNSVLVLAHLILNDMMKVKGHITELALHFEDEDVRVASLVNLFFHELSKKGSTTIYNLLPDMMSRISCKNLPQQQFRSTLQFLFSFISTDKHTEGLVEKLCNRFPGTTDPKQWRDIAYCISELKFSEKAIKKLMDMFKVYELALVEEEVVQHFEIIISKAKKLAKPELKAIYDEFGDKIRVTHKEKREQECTLQHAIMHKTRSKECAELPGLDVQVEDDQDVSRSSCDESENRHKTTDPHDPLGKLTVKGLQTDSSSSHGVGDSSASSSSCAGEVTEADECANHGDEVTTSTGHGFAHYDSTLGVEGDHVKYRGCASDTSSDQQTQCLSENIDGLMDGSASIQDNQDTNVEEKMLWTENGMDSAVKEPAEFAGRPSGSDDDVKEALMFVDREVPIQTGEEGSMSGVTISPMPERNGSELGERSVFQGEHVLELSSYDHHSNEQLEPAIQGRATPSRRRDEEAENQAVTGRFINETPLQREHLRFSTLDEKSSSCAKTSQNLRTPMRSPLQIIKNEKS